MLTVGEPFWFPESVWTILIVGIGPLGVQIFQTGVRRRKYKLGPTKQFPVQIFASLARVYTARFRRHEIQDSGIGIRNPEWRMHFQSTVVPEALPGTR